MTTAVTAADVVRLKETIVTINTFKNVNKEESITFLTQLLSKLESIVKENSGDNINNDITINTLNNKIQNINDKEFNNILNEIESKNNNDIDIDVMFLFFISIFIFYLSICLFIG